MRVIAFAGNPNVGKSTLFNALTGKRQHTGNWCGKTVSLAEGDCEFRGCTYRLVDLPGAYSLHGGAPEEKIAAEFLRGGEADCTIAVCDTTCLERSMILALQVIALCPRVVLCLNLTDEARHMGMEIDVRRLERELGVPVVPTSANHAEGTQQLMQAVRDCCESFLPERMPEAAPEDPRAYVLRAQELARSCTKQAGGTKKSLTARLDAILLHRFFGYFAMLLLLLCVFWLTIEAANYPSQGLQWCFDRLGDLLRRGAQAISLPPLLTSAVLDGVYATTARVVAVMLPPMAIFFPLFSLLEDFGYLPRAAFLLDERFRRAGACGKQSLTLCMGFGCNAAGVTGCRIIDSPRERLIATLTNAFTPCNGRFPAMIFLISMSFAGGSALLGAGILTGCVLLSIVMTLLASALLHKTALRGEPSSFVLELPPYRRPRILQVLWRSLWERTVKILWRAVLVAAPAGLVIWVLANIRVGGESLLVQAAAVFNAPAALLGMSGAVLLAFVLASPANELVLPIAMMILTAQTTLAESGSAAMTQTLLANGWDWRMSVCTLLFFLFHWPCTTTLLTIYKETRSRKHTLLALLLPTAFGIVLCAAVNLLLQLI